MDGDLDAQVPTLFELSPSRFHAMSMIGRGVIEGGRIVAGGGRMDGDHANGYFIPVTILADVANDSEIARNEVFGPVLSVIKWRDEEEMFEQVNSVEYGLTAAIFTTSLATAHRAASRVEAGFVWVNNSSFHFLGVPFGGYKQSGIGREESIEELLSFTQIKNINITL